MSKWGCDMVHYSTIQTVLLRALSNPEPIAPGYQTDSYKVMKTYWQRETKRSSWSLSSTNKQTQENQTMKIGQTITVSIYGKNQKVKIVAIHDFGTVDIETKEGNYFRLSGLSLA